MSKTRHYGNLNGSSLHYIFPRPNSQTLQFDNSFKFHSEDTLTSIQAFTLPFSFDRTRSNINQRTRRTMSIIPSLPPSQPSASLTIEDTISDAQRLISKWKYNRVSATTPPAFLFITNSQEAKDYIERVHELRRIMDFYVSTHTESPNIALAHNLMQSAMQRLEMEFHHLLSVNNEYFNVTLTSSDEGAGYDALSSSFADDLKMIAHCMIKAGYGIECARAYKSVRKQAVDEDLINLGFQKLGTLKINKGTSDEELEQRVKTWIHTMLLAMGRLFNNERTLCDHIFSSASDALGESSFAETTAKGAINIFTIGEIVANAKGKSSKGYIFRLLDMHIAIQEAIPDIQSIFSFESTSLVQQQALNLLSKIRNSIHQLVNYFESSLKKHSTRTTVHGGGIHTLTQSSMDHIAHLADYTHMLSTIITDHPSPADKIWMPESYFNTKTASIDSPISIRFARLILVLLCKLDKIAENYKEISLSYLFLSNNLHFIVSKVRNARNLLNLIGEAWIITHHRTAKKYAMKYEFTSWHKVIKPISLEADDVLIAHAAQSRLRKFRSALEEAIEKQRMWTVVDGRMREDLKASIARRLVSAYSEFYEASAGLLDERDVVSFGTGNIESLVSELFGGVSYSGGSLSGSLSSSSSSSSSSSASASPMRRFFSRLPNKSKPSNDTLGVV